MYGVEPGSGLAVLLDWLARPYDPERVTAGAARAPDRGCRGSSSGRCSPPARRPRTCSTPCPTIVRSMAIATTDQPERCVGEIRGPVLWGETMSARSSSAGIPGCSCAPPPRRPTTRDENRVLKAALAVVHRAGRHAEHGMDGLHRRRREAGPPQRPARRSPARAPDPRPGARRAAHRPRPAPHPGREPAPHLPPRPRPAAAGRRADAGAAHLSAFADERTARPARPARGHPAAPRGRHRRRARCSAATTGA